MYIQIKNKFWLTVALSIVWVIACLIIDYSWFLNLSQSLGYVFAVIVILGVAIIPGAMICYFSLGGLLFDDHKRKPIIISELEPVTILIAAYNEEDCIYDTLKSIALQQYPAKLIVKVIDNNSRDHTKEEVMRAIADFSELHIEYMFEKTQGKYAALNSALPTVDTRYFITIDADTYLYRNALLKLANAMIQENKNKKVAAIAGTILVRNSRVNLLTKMEEWEYFLSIATIKRSQGLFQTTMVAQGAFSIYDTNLIRSIGGYKNAIAEDIVLTWEALSSQQQKESFQDKASRDISLTCELLSSGEYRTYYCDDAIAFTNVPTTLKAFARQRRRWARGSIEGFKHFSFKTCKNPYTKFYMLVNYVNMVGEFGTTFILIPGVIAAIFFHNFLLIGKSTILLFLLTVFIYLVMWYKQMKYVFRPLGLKVRRHYGALIVYMLFFAMILSPVCLCGYVDEIFKTKRRWK